MCGILGAYSCAGRLPEPERFGAAPHASNARDVFPVLWGVLMLLCFVSRNQRALTQPLRTLDSMPLAATAVRGAPQPVRS